MRDIFLHFRLIFAVFVCVPVGFYHGWLLHTVNIYLAVLQLIAQVYHKFSKRISIYLRMKRGLSNGTIVMHLQWRYLVLL